MPVNTNSWNRVRYRLYAPVYDVIAPWTAKSRRRSIALLDLQPHERVLVVGCGTGLDFPFLPKRVQVTAGDLSPAMVQRAWKRAEAVGLCADVREFDAHRLPFADASFDAVLLHLILAVVPDPEAAIREAARVLRPHGRLCIFDKFLPDHAQPSVSRLLLGAVISLLVTDINRRLGPLLSAAGLEAVHEEPAMLGGFFKIVVARPVAP